MPGGNSNSNANSSSLEASLSELEDLDLDLDVNRGAGSRRAGRGLGATLLPTFVAIHLCMVLGGGTCGPLARSRGGVCFTEPRKLSSCVFDEGVPDGCFEGNAPDDGRGSTACQAEGSGSVLPELAAEDFWSRTATMGLMVSTF